MANEGQGAKRKKVRLRRGGVQARGLAGWLVRRDAMRMGGAVGMCLYILVFLLPQPVRLHALFETCVGGQL